MQWIHLWSVDPDPQGDDAPVDDIIARTEARAPLVALEYYGKNLSQNSYGSVTIIVITTSTIGFLMHGRQLVSDLHTNLQLVGHSCERAPLTMLQLVATDLTSCK